MRPGPSEKFSPWAQESPNPTISSLISLSLTVTVHTVEREMAPSSLVRYSRWISRFKFPYSQNNLFPSPPPFSSTTTAGLHNADSVTPGGPPPIRVSLTDSAGRGVFATRKIGAGELIHTAKPLVAHPTLSAVHRVCNFCLGKLRNANAKSEAHRGSFCGEECERHSKVSI